MKEAKVSINGIFFMLLGLLFIALKLTDYIDWPWWLVLLPIWGPIVFGFLIVAILLGFVGVMSKMNK